MKKFFSEGGRPTREFIDRMMGIEHIPESVLPRAIAARFVRVTTDPWPIGDAPINSFNTFEALLREARPQLCWKGLHLHSDEDQLRQTTAEAVLLREMGRLRISITFNDAMSADERLDLAEAVLLAHFKARELP